MGLVWAFLNMVMSTSFQKELEMSLRTERLLPFQERFSSVIRYVTLPETCYHLRGFRLTPRREVFALLRCFSVLIGSCLRTSLQVPKPNHSWNECRTIEPDQRIFRIFFYPSRKGCYLSGNKDVRAWNSRIITIKKLN